MGLSLTVHRKGGRKETGAFTEAVSDLQLSFKEGILIYYLLSQMRKVARISLPRASELTARLT